MSDIYQSRIIFLVNYFSGSAFGFVALGKVDQAFSAAKKAAHYGLILALFEGVETRATPDPRFSMKGATENACITLKAR